MKKVLLAEDHSIVLKGLLLIFEKEFPGYEVYTVNSLAGLMKTLQQESFCLAVIDMQLEDGLSLSLVPDILRLYPAMPLLMFTGFSEDVYAQRLFRYGVKGFLHKNSPESEIVYALQTVLAGKTYLSDYYRAWLQDRRENKPAQDNPFQQLSPRELETALLLLKGKRSSEICSALNIQPSTVTTHKIKIFTKLGVTNIVDLEKLASAYQLV